MPIKNNFVIIFSLLLLLTVTVFIISACGSPVEHDQASDKDWAEPVDNQIKEIIPAIGPISFEPEGEMGPDGLIMIAEQVKISVEAHAAQRVEFYVTPAKFDGLGVLFRDDSNPADGWTAFWEPPLAGEPFRLTAIAYFNGTTVHSSSTVISQAEDTETPLPGESENTPFTLLNQQSTISVIERLPRYFQSAGWIDKQTIFGLSGNNPVLFNLETGEVNFPHINVWGAHLSPGKRYFSYINEHGIHVTRIDGKENRHLWPRETVNKEGSPQGGLWSPNEDKLLVWWESEWDSAFYISELHNERVQELKTKLDGYFLTAVTGWTDGKNIIFTTRASMMKDGTREYSFGYRSDLAVYNLETGSFRLLTDSADGEFIEGLSTSPEGIFFLRWFESRNEVYYGVINLSGQVVWEQQFNSPAGFFLAPDGRTVACLVETDRKEINTVYKLSIISPEGSINIMELQMADHLMPQIFWHPAGKKLLFSFSTTVLQAEPPDTYRDLYYTLVVEP